MCKQQQVRGFGSLDSSTPASPVLLSGDFHVSVQVQPVIQPAASAVLSTPDILRELVQQLSVQPEAASEVAPVTDESDIVAAQAASLVSARQAMQLMAELLEQANAGAAANSTDATSQASVPISAAAVQAAPPHCSAGRAAQQQLSISQCSDHTNAAAGNTFSAFRGGQMLKALRLLLSLSSLIMPELESPSVRLT